MSEEATQGSVIARAKGADGGAVAERNDDELEVDNATVGNGGLANSGQCRPSLRKKMKTISLVIPDPFSSYIDTDSFPEGLKVYENR